MRVLIACEESQVVCIEFRALGHEAYSCDIQEPSGGHPEWHILGDALKAIEGGRVTTMGGQVHDVGRRCERSDMVNDALFPATRISGKRRTAAAKGYMSRKVTEELEEYTGKFGMTRRCDNGTIQNH